MSDLLSDIVMLGEILKFCSSFLKCVFGPNCWTLYYYIDLNRYPKGCLPHIEMVLLCWKIKQGWCVDLWVVVLFWCSFVISLLVFEMFNCAQLLNFVPLYGPEAISQRLFASHWNGFVVLENKTRLMGDLFSDIVTLVKFCNFVLAFWSAYLGPIVEFCTFIWTWRNTLKAICLTLEWFCCVGK